MSMYRVTYIDQKLGDTVHEWEGEAEDSSDALDKAMDDDYYFGSLISVEEV